MLAVAVQAVAMAVAPDLFVYDHALTALNNFENALLGRHQIGRVASDRLLSDSEL